MMLTDIYQLRTELHIVIIQPSIKILEELKLIFSTTIPHNLCFFFPSR